jgi:hypothetical protein
MKKSLVATRWQQFTTVATVSSRWTRVLSRRQLRQAKNVSWRLCFNGTQNATVLRQSGGGGGRRSPLGELCLSFYNCRRMLVRSRYEINLRQCDDSCNHMETSIKIIHDKHFTTRSRQNNHGNQGFINDPFVVNTQTSLPLGRVY